MHFDESFWVALATILFILLLIYYIKKSLGQFFNDRAQEIRQKINEAELLQTKSEKLLQEYKAIYEDVDRAVKDLSLETEKEISYLKEKALDDLEKHLLLKKEHALKQIEVKKLNLVRNLKKQAIKLSLSTVSFLIKNHNFSKTNASIINSALADFSKNIGKQDVQ